MSTNLTRYNQSRSDRNTAAHDESLFGHYVEEQGWSVKETLENLAPIAKQTYSQTVSVASTTKWLAVIGGVVGLLGGGTVGLIGALPIGAAALAFVAFREANQCISRREIELRALKNCPNLLELMYGCSMRGAETRNLIAAWDIFLDNYEQSGSCDANLMAREYLRILDGLSFTIDNGEVEIPKERPESIAPVIGNNTRLGAIDVPAQTSQRRSIGSTFEDLLKNSQPTAAKTDHIDPEAQPSTPRIDPTCDVRTIANSNYIESVIWLGASRSGKTVAADQLYQEYKERYPTIKAWYVTPVYRADEDNSELALFEGAIVARYDLLNEWNQEIISSCYAEYERLLDEFLAAPSSQNSLKLFVCDELSIHRCKAFKNPKTGYDGNEIARRFYGKYINSVTANSSGGKAVGIGLWGLAPIGAVGGLGIERYALSAMIPVFVSHVDNWNGAVWAGAKNNQLAPDSEPTEDFKRSVRSLKCDRVVSIGCGAWKALKNYPIKRIVAAKK